MSVDLDSPLGKQHGRNFDVTEDILMLTNNDGSRTRSESIASALERVKRLENYTPIRNPTYYLVDTPAKMKALMCQEKIAVILMRCLMRVFFLEEWCFGSCATFC